MEPLRDIGISQQPVPRSPGSENEAPRKRPARGIVIAVVVCLVVAFLIYSGIHARSESETRLTRETEAAATPMVRTVHPSGGGAPGEVTLPANVEAYIDTPIYARTSGYLRHWYADIGARVKQGQLLAVIETPELDQQVVQAQDDVKTAQTNVQLAQITATRWEKLLAKNAVSKQEADQNTSNLSAQQSTLSSQQANLARLLQLQSFEHIYAPFDGVITVRNIDTGALIEAGDNTMPKELFHLAAVRKLRVFVPVPEVYESAVHDGQHVVLTSDAFPNEKFAGTLVRSSHAVDPGSRTLNVEVDVDNVTGKLLPGAYAFVHLNVPGEARALTVPSNTLLFRSEGLRVGVVENGHVQLKPITLGHDYGATVEVLSGITAQDQIILDPADSLESGDAVQIASEPSKSKGEGQ
jgi:RND family efflux transporter MFP subunit